MLTHLTLVIAILLVTVALQYIKSTETASKPQRKKMETYAGASCSIDSNHACNSLTGAPLHPVNDASYNLKQIIIQMLLLEDHLFHKEKQCTSCIKKHILMIEGLADEGITLDISNTYTTAFETILELMTEIEKIYSSNPSLAAQQLREVRRQYITQV